MKVDKESMLLYVVTDRSWLGSNLLHVQVEKIIKAGATFIQLREKDLSFDQFVKIAEEMKEVTDKYQVPFVINDNVQVAIKVNADGVHVGQSDMKAKDVRTLIGPDKILGVSVQTVEQAVQAEKSGADYLGVGAVFSTSTKLDANQVSFETIKEICSSVSIPVVAIGGIDQNNISDLKGSGIAGVAVVSAIFAKPDVAKATADLYMLAKGLFA
ncbi:MAG: thiamine phosphate synthase [Bacillota bacterium]|nr:thiamine phosphate synthase [Clostridia bacterium]